MKIGVYGGSFDPIHAGHLHILEGFTRRLGLDRVLLVPAGSPPHKEAPGLAPAEDRLAMCALAAETVKAVPVEVCSLELERPGKSYTADTLETLRAKYPRDELYLLMGEDMFLTVDRWYRPERICALAALCATPRSGDGLDRLLAQKRRLEESLAARCFVEEIPWLPVSATDIRRRVNAGEPLGELAPPAVEAYIRERGLYRMGFDDYAREVKRHLSEKRYYHSQCVAEAAAMLAVRYGADPEQARVAGILHDVMKDTPGEEQLKIIADAGIILSDTEQRAPNLWHAIAGAAYAQRVLGVSDPEVLGAIRWHTSGRGGMSLPEKVLFVADYISADRDYPSADKMREAAQRSLEETIVRGVAYTLYELTDRCRTLDGNAVDAYNEALAALDEETRARMQGHSAEFIG